MNINVALRAKKLLSYTSTVKTLNNMSQVMILQSGALSPYYLIKLKLWKLVSAHHNLGEEAYAQLKCIIICT